MTPSTAPKVSVIVPVYDVEFYLVECIGSVLRQSYRNIEVLAIDDGSPDSSGDILDQIATQDNRLLVQHTANHGVSHARNFGLSRATGDYVCFVDADDVLGHHFVEGMLDLATTFNADMVVSTRSMASPMEKQPTTFSGRLRRPEYVIAEFFYPRIPIGSWNKLYSTQFLRRENIRFATDLFAGEGQHFIVSAAQRSAATVMTGQSAYYYRRNRPGSAVTEQSASKWKNALVSISIIRQALVLDSYDVTTALDFHEWETRYLMLRHFALSGEKAPYDLIQESASFIRKKAARLVFSARIPMRYRLKIAASALSPRGVAAAIAKRVKRRASVSP